MSLRATKHLSPEWHKVKEIVSGLALATGIVAPRFPMQNRRYTPCRSPIDGLTLCHSIYHPPACGRVGRGSGRGGFYSAFRVISDGKPVALSGPESPTLPEGE